MEGKFWSKIFDFVLGTIGEESRERGKFNLQSVILHEIGKAVRASEESREKTLQLIAESMLQIFPVNKIVIYLYEKHENIFSGKIGAGILDKRLLNVKIDAAFAELFREGSVKLVPIADLPGNFKELQDLFSTSRLILLALRESEKLMGFLLIEPSHEVKDLRNEELRLYEYFAFIMSGVLHNAEMVSNLKRKTERLEALSEIVKAVNSTLEVDRLLNLIVEKAIELTGSTSGSIILIDKDTGKLLIKAYRGLPPGTENLKLDIGQGVTGIVARLGVSKLVNDVEDDPDYIVANPQVKSEMAVPLVKDGEVIGVLNVDNVKRNAYEEEDLKLLEMLAGSAVIALNNAMLFGRCKETGVQNDG